jgi:hypothetical protein
VLIFGIASGSKGAGISVAFAVAVVLGWAWISAMAARLMTGLLGAEGEPAGQRTISNVINHYHKETLCKV